MLGSNFRLPCQLPNPISGFPPYTHTHTLSFLQPPGLGCAFVRSMESASSARSWAPGPRTPPGRGQHSPYPRGAGREPSWLSFPKTSRRAALWIGSLILMVCGRRFEPSLGWDGGGGAGRGRPGGRPAAPLRVRPN